MNNPIDSSEEVVFRVTTAEAETILEALGQLRFSVVYRLIGKLQTQAREQLDQPADQGGDPA